MTIILIEFISSCEYVRRIFPDRKIFLWENNVVVDLNGKSKTERENYEEDDGGEDKDHKLKVLIISKYESRCFATS